jgi:hypothetical protein
MRVKSQARAPKILRLGFAERDLSHTEVNKLIFRYRMAGHGAVAEDWTFRPGFLYNTTRAIAARINQNYDAWPSDQLKKYYKTFIGKPIFVNHMNEDPDKARGVVVAARYVEGKNGARDSDRRSRRRVHGRRGRVHHLQCLRQQSDRPARHVRPHQAPQGLDDAARQDR